MKGLSAKGWAGSRETHQDGEAPWGRKSWNPPNLRAGGERDETVQTGGNGCPIAAVGSGWGASRTSHSLASRDSTPTLLSQLSQSSANTAEIQLEPKRERSPLYAL